MPDSGCREGVKHLQKQCYHLLSGRTSVGCSIIMLQNQHFPQPAWFVHCFNIVKLFIWVLGWFLYL
jgi:hypothetical protein